jgi:putative CocE/NonD family hydrolase
MFETGGNRWRRFDAWPPKGVRAKSLYFHAGGKLTEKAPADEKDAHDEYCSDPLRPVPFTEAVAIGMTTEHMVDDQRFASRRPDVLVYQTDVLSQDVTLAGPMQAELWVSTSGTDSDWVVKVIDVYPGETKDVSAKDPLRRLGGYQQLVRSEVMRGRFRNSYEKPEPFVVNEPARVGLELQDVLHTFRKGHRIMVQISSTWFPLVDRNPQRYVKNIFQAEPRDFIRTTQHVYRSANMATRLEVGVLPHQGN